MIASQITEPLEQQINGIDGIRVLSSISSEERSQIRVEFEVGADLEAAANDVRDRVSRAVRNLPPDADPPVVEKADADSEPILFLSVQSPTRSILEVNDFADRVLRERIQTIPGVEQRAHLRREALRDAALARPGAARRARPHAARRADRARRAERRPAERAARGQRRRALAAHRGPAHHRRGVRRDDPQGATTAGRSCCATSAAPSSAPRTCAPASSATACRWSALAVIPQPNTNAIAIADEFYRAPRRDPRVAPADYHDRGRLRLHDLRAPLDPRGRGDDAASPSRWWRSIIYLFLRSWRSTLIPVLAIPVSIVAAFFVMYLAGFTINVLTLVGHRARDRAGLRRRDRRARERLREDRARARRRSRRRSRARARSTSP